MSGHAWAPPAKAARIVDEVIRSRRSVRAFLPDAVPLEVVRAILDVAARAPSGTNVQPWHVHVVAGAAKERLSRAVLAARQRGEERPEYTYYPKSWREPFLGRRRAVGFGLYRLLGIEKGDSTGRLAQFGRNFEFFGAPVGLFFTLDRDLELASWVDMGMFIQSVMLAARARGLDTCPQAAWVGYHTVIRAELGIPDGEALVCGMSLGYADDSAPENELVTDREAVESFARFVGF